jgi:HEAT repeat protein
MAQSEDVLERRKAADLFYVSFAFLIDYKQVWNDIHLFIQDNDSVVRYRSVGLLCAIFSQISDKKQAWMDLIRLTQDENEEVRWGAAFALHTVFSQVPDKKEAWNDLHLLTEDAKSEIRRGAAYTLGEGFMHIPDKKQAYDDLQRLTNDEYVRVSAYNSLGKASIFRAANAEKEEEFRIELEKAISYFEETSKLGIFYKPARFCLPFYRSFYTLIFKKEDSEAEVQKYLLEAKSAVQGSESKEKLLEAVENLGNALKEVQNARDFNDMKSDLNAYRRYLDRVCELLDTTEDKASGASRLIRKGLPIIDERIKGVIAEINEKAKALCKQVKETEFKEIGQQVNNVGQELSKAIDPIRLEKEVSRMLIPISAMCKKMPEEDRGEACEILKQINDEQNLEDKLPLISMFLSKISTQMNQKKEQNMSININSSGTQSRVNIGSVDTSTNLITGDLKTDLEYLKNRIENDY